MANLALPAFPQQLPWHLVACKLDTEPLGVSWLILWGGADVRRAFFQSRQLKTRSGQAGIDTAGTEDHANKPSRRGLILEPHK